jgi:hypothetical protein
MRTAANTSKQQTQFNGKETEIKDATELKRLIHISFLRLQQAWCVQRGHAS